MARRIDLRVLCGAPPKVTNSLQCSASTFHGVVDGHQVFHAGTMCGITTRAAPRL